MRRNARWKRVVVLGLTLTALAAACSKKTDTSTGSSPAPETQRASPADVAAGLRQIDKIAKDVAAKAGTDKAAAQQLDAQIEPAWQKVEGTVKANNQDAYLGFEDNFAVLEGASKDGDAAKAATAAAAVAKAVSDYLAAYPG